MNQAIEQAIIDHTNKVWEQAHKVGLSDEQDRIIKLIEVYKEDVLIPVKFAIKLIKGEAE